MQSICIMKGKCANGKWFPYCCVGCRGIGFGLTGDVFGSDQSKCLKLTAGEKDNNT